MVRRILVIAVRKLGLCEEKAINIGTKASALLPECIQFTSSPDEKSEDVQKWPCRIIYQLHLIGKSRSRKLVPAHSALGFQWWLPPHSYYIISGIILDTSTPTLQQIHKSGLLHFVNNHDAFPITHLSWSRLLYYIASWKSSVPLQLIGHSVV